jgi:hypothetical protein
VFEIERIFPNSAVQCIAVYTGNDESLWQLSQKHMVLNVIHVAGGYRVHFYFYSSDEVFTAGLFQCFHVTEVGAFQLIKQGNLRVEIHFAEALTAIINVIMHAEFNNVIEIDRNRQVLFDYSA